MKLIIAASHKLSRPQILWITWYFTRLNLKALLCRACKLTSFYSLEHSRHPLMLSVTSVFEFEGAKVMASVTQYLISHWLGGVEIPEKMLISGPLTLFQPERQIKPTTLLKVSKYEKHFFWNSIAQKTNEIFVKILSFIGKNFIRHLGNGVSRKIAFKIYWPL